jgi:ABC-type nitrate/sulfonate/bicarbonate transport system ATPase subunit
MKPVLQCQGIGKTFRGRHQEFVALSDISLETYQGEFLSIIGPSGCGKTTLLSIMGGLIPPTTGRVLLDGAPVTEPHPDRIGFIFQDYSLLPWRNALKNVELGLEIRMVDKAERHARAMEYLRLVDLERFASAYPLQLSGGMRQRVAIARSLALGCDILLLDEPFGALDEQTRFAMGRELAAIHERTQGCVVLVTHSISEAIFLSDRVAVMQSAPGTIRDILEVPLGRPRELRHRAKEEFRDLEQTLWQYLEPPADEPL